LFARLAGGQLLSGGLGQWCSKSTHVVMTLKADR
jgi:hypothetical protein